MLVAKFCQEHHLEAFDPGLSWQWQFKVFRWHGLLSPICCRLLWCSCGLKWQCRCCPWLWTCWWQWRKIPAVADYQRCWNWGRKKYRQTTIKRKLMTFFFRILTSLIPHLLCNKMPAYTWPGLSAKNSRTDALRQKFLVGVDAEVPVDFCWTATQLQLPCPSAAKRSRNAESQYFNACFIISRCPAMSIITLEWSLR